MAINTDRDKPTYTKILYQNCIKTKANTSFRLQTQTKPFINTSINIDPLTANDELARCENLTFLWT